MAKITSNLQYTDTFSAWFDKTNQTLEDMRTVVVTAADVAQPNTFNGAWTSGNAHVEGIFSADTLVAGNGLRGGSTSNSDVLVIESSTNIQGLLLTVNGTIEIATNGEKEIKARNTTSSYQPLNIVLETTTASITPLVITETNIKKGDANTSINLGAPLNSWNTLYIEDIVAGGNVDIEDSITVGSNLDVVETITANNIIIDTDATVNGDLFVAGQLSVPANIVFQIAQSEITDLTVLTSIEMGLTSRVKSDFIPDSDNGDYDLGDTDERWNALFVDNISAAGDIVADGNVEGKLNWDDIVYNRPDFYNQTQADLRYYSALGGTISGDVVVNGGITANTELSFKSGVSVTYNANTNPSASPTQNAVIATVNRGNLGDAALYWDEVSNTWKIHDGISANDIAGSISAGTLISVSKNGSASVISHANTNNIDAGVFGSHGISSITLDDFGHITNISALEVTGSSGVSVVTGSNSLTITNSDRGSSQNIFKTIATLNSSGASAGSIVADNNNDTATIQVQGPITISGSPSNDRIIIGHTTSVAQDVSGSGGTVINGLNLDSYGHISGTPSTTNLDTRFALRSTNISAGSGLTGGGNLSGNRTISHGNTSNLSGSYGGTNNGTIIERVTFDSFGHATSIQTRNLDDRYMRSDTNATTIGTISSKGLNVQNSVSNHIEADGAFYRYNSQVYLTVDDNLYVRDQNNGVKFYFDTNGGNLTATGNIAAFSDAKLKTNVKVVENALDKVTQMRGVTYEKDGSKEVGVIAQEMEKVLPEVVSTIKTENDELKTVAYGNIVGVLIEAIKELKAEIDELKGNK